MSHIKLIRRASFKWVPCTNGCTADLIQASRMYDLVEMRISVYWYRRELTELNTDETLLHLLLPWLPQSDSFTLGRALPSLFLWVRSLGFSCSSYGLQADLKIVVNDGLTEGLLSLSHVLQTVATSILMAYRSSRGVFMDLKLI